jgi:hypothetical protein
VGSTIIGTSLMTGVEVGTDKYRTNKSLKKQEEIASRKLIAKTTKKCPGCKRSIEKSYGCDHMTCKIPTLYPSCVCIFGGSRVSNNMYLVTGC